MTLYIANTWLFYQESLILSNNDLQFKMLQLIHIPWIKVSCVVMYHSTAFEDQSRLCIQMQLDLVLRQFQDHMVREKVVFGEFE